MLVLSRKTQERIQIGDNVVVTVLRVKGNMVRIGIEAPKDVRVMRGELPPKDAPALEVTIERPGSNLRKLAEAVLARRHDVVSTAGGQAVTEVADLPSGIECDFELETEMLVS
jgi:carbon storage regulator CsrA